MKLRFFNGLGKVADEDLLRVVNGAISLTGLSFEFFKLNGDPIHSFDGLCTGFASEPKPLETTIALLHLNQCPGIDTAINQWHSDRRKELIIILFSRDPMQEARVLPTVAASKGVGIPRIAWLHLGLQSAVVAAEFQAFFKWLAGATAPSLEQICEAIDRHFTKNEVQELLRPLAILCEGALAVYEARTGPSAARVPAIAIKRVSDPQWWRECLSMSARDRTVEVLCRELRPKLPSLAGLPSELANLLDAVFGNLPIPEATIRAARDYCRPIAW